MNSDKKRFLKRKNRTRSKILSVSSNRPRLSVFRSNKYVYAQIIDDSTSSTIASASSLEKTLKNSSAPNLNVAIAIEVGKLVSKRAAEKGVKKVVFDKGGYMYHGIIKALADAARENLEF